MFVESIEFKRDIVVRSSRGKHLPIFKMKGKSYKVDDRSRPLPKKSDRIYERTRYAQKTIKYKEFSLFKAGLNIEFSNLTIIVGDNGSGKSSLIQYFKPPKLEGMLSFSEDDDTVKKRRISEWLNNEDSTLRFKASPDLIIIEKQIHKSDFIKNIGAGRTILTANQVIQKWNMSEDSNGETTIDYIESLKNLENCLIVLDEPETSLSIKTQVRLSKLLAKVAKKNQLIIVTHSPVFMNMSKSVYDFEAKQYVKTKTYIDEQYS